MLFPCCRHRKTQNQHALNNFTDAERMTVVAISVRLVEQVHVCQEQVYLRRPCILHGLRQSVLLFDALMKQRRFRSGGATRAARARPRMPLWRISLVNTGLGWRLETRDEPLLVTTWWNTLR
jgi:hypothetical protein